MRWPFVSRKKYEAAEANSKTYHHWYIEQVKVSRTLREQNSALYAELSKLKQPRDERGRFVRKG